MTWRFALRGVPAIMLGCGLAMALPAAVQADPPPWAHGQGKHRHLAEEYPPGVVIYEPAPVYVAPPRPVYVVPAPVYAPPPSLSIIVPLR